MKCGRCNEPATLDVCWYCAAPLCGTCWEDVSHCGHAEAEAANVAARAVRQPGGEA